MRLSRPFLLAAHLGLAAWATPPAHLLNTSDMPWLLVLEETTAPLELHQLDSAGILRSVPLGGPRLGQGQVTLAPGAALSLGFRAEPQSQGSFAIFRMIDWHNRAPKDLPGTGQSAMAAGLILQASPESAHTRLSPTLQGSPFRHLNEAGSVVAAHLDAWPALLEPMERKTALEAFNEAFTPLNLAPEQSAGTIWDILPTLSPEQEQALQKHLSESI